MLKNRRVKSLIHLKFDATGILRIGKYPLVHGTRRNGQFMMIFIKGFKRGDKSSNVKNVVSSGHGGWKLKYCVGLGKVVDMQRHFKRIIRPVFEVYFVIKRLRQVKVSIGRTVWFFIIATHDK